VKSNDSHGAFDGDDGHVRNPRGTKHSALLDDPFLQVDEPLKETAEEKKLRLAKDIIKEYASEQKNDFFESLFSKAQAEY